MSPVPAPLSLAHCSCSCLYFRDVGAVPAQLPSSGRGDGLAAKPRARLCAGRFLFSIETRPRKCARSWCNSAPSSPSLSCSFLHLSPRFFRPTFFLRFVDSLAEEFDWSARLPSPSLSSPLLISPASSILVRIPGVSILGALMS